MSSRSVFEIDQRPTGFYLIWAPSPSEVVMSVWIGKGTMVYELAVDAACEFMDRYRSAVEQGIDANTLMHSCVMNAVNQN